MSYVPAPSDFGVVHDPHDDWACATGAAAAWYRRLTFGLGEDQHVVACALAIAAAEHGGDPAPGTGLGAREIDALSYRLFGHDRPVFLRASEDAPLLDEMEADLRALLVAGAPAGDALAAPLASLVVRRGLEPGHLWRAMGLRNRRELSAFLTRRFPGLAARNTQNMRWKKFFYRELCLSEGALLCKSPVCTACPDYRECFA